MNSKKYILKVITLLLSIIVISNSRVIYVDNTLSSDITNGTYSIQNRNNSGSDGDAYNTLRDVLWGSGNGSGNQAASVGDTIYIRYGTYRETYGLTSSDGGAAMQISSSLNGTSWNSGQFTTISGYPEDDLPIIDGGGGSHYIAFGASGLSNGTDNTRLHYLVIERLEVINGSAGGIGIKEGPVQIRFCYVHDNGKGSYGDDNRASLHFRRLEDSIIEYNFLKDNSGNSDNNKNHIIIYADYLYTSDSYDINYCNHNNEIRYNLFEGSTHTAYKDKADQLLGSYNNDGSMTDMTNQTLGNRIHHNIFIDCTISIDARQYFEQVHHNICDGGGITSEDGSGIRAHFYQTWYNNTVIRGYITQTMGYSRPENSLDLCFWGVNNIITGFGTTDYNPSFGIAVNWQRSCSGSYTWNNTRVDRNLIHNPQSSSHLGNPDSYTCKSERWVSTSTFNTQRGTNNYSNSSTGLFVGSTDANKYITNRNFVLSGSTTILNGGIGGQHPFLDGISIPSYVGAVDPNDSGWVTIVLNLANLENGGAPANEPPLPPGVYRPQK